MWAISATRQKIPKLDTWSDSACQRIPNIYIKGLLSINLDPTKLKKGSKI